MNKSLISRILLSGVLGFLVLLFAAFLANIPRLNAEEGLPLIPALISAEAVLIAIGLCGYGVYALLLKQVIGRMRLEQSRPKSGELPWAHNAEWLRREVTHSSKGAALFLWLFVANWWAVLIFAAQDRGAELANGSLPILLLCLVLVGIGIVSTWTAVRKTVQWLTYGRSVLEIETLPGRPGGVFRGTVKIGFKPKRGRPVFVDLVGFTRHWSEQSYIPHEEERGIGDVRNSVPFLQDEQKVSSNQLRGDGSGTDIPIQFKIPRDVPSSGLVDRDMEVIWKVKVRATTPSGTDFDAEYEIPIYGN
ncbi:MAG: hypothetical protein MPJ78_17130 [Hyphomicrobiaceae bacterium]|nr:hypothetical protein [Hyphomicrobiaceae bacterium]